MNPIVDEVLGASVNAPAAAPDQVLGVQETRPAALPRTGGELEALLFLAGLSMALAGLVLLAAHSGRRPITAA
ncbi:MAG TPA: LPXTG cell wall anchor domain-containing protein [Acidimicrobiia bacterium]|nr:LPXTG cell wall anchor domain-containing protein [Acidimicrobiia bacterium]